LQCQYVHLIKILFSKLLYFCKNIHNQNQLTSILAFVHRGISTIMLKTFLSELANNGTSWKGEMIPVGPPIKTSTPWAVLLSWYYSSISIFSDNRWNQ